MAHDARIPQPVAKARAGAPIKIAGVTKHYAAARGGDVHALAEIDLSIARASSCRSSDRAVAEKAHC